MSEHACALLKPERMYEFFLPLPSHTTSVSFWCKVRKMRNAFLLSKNFFHRGVCLNTCNVIFFSVDKILSLSEKDMVKHLKIIVDNIGCPEKGPPSQKRVNLLNYVGSIAANSLIAGYLVRMGALGVLARQVKETQHLDG